MILRSVCYNNNNNTEWVWVGCFYSACFNSEGSLDDFCELSCDFPLQYMQHGAGMGLEGCPSRVCGTGVGTGVGFSTDVFPWSERQWGRQGGECVMPWQSWDRTLSEVLRTCGAQAVLPECSCGCFAGDRRGLSGQPLWGYQPVLAMLNV